jgi:hypothetical protein
MDCGSRAAALPRPALLAVEVGFIVTRGSCLLPQQQVCPT